MAAVLKKQKETTVAKLIDAGMVEDNLRFYCEVMVERVRWLPDRLKQQRERKNQAKPAVPALNTVVAFAKVLFSGDKPRFQPLGKRTRIWSQAEILDVLSYLKQEARRFENADPNELGASRQPELDDERASRWTAVRAELGVFAHIVKRDTGSINATLVDQPG